MVETISIEGRAYTLDELEALLGVERIEEPYSTTELQALINEANTESSNALAELLVALVVLALLPRPPARITYSVRDRSYYQGAKPLTQPQLTSTVFAEAQQNATRYQRRTQLMLGGRLSLEQWQQQMGRDIVRSHIRMAQGGAGTAQQLTPAHIRALRQRVRDELGALAGFAEQLRAGEVSERMALYRAGRYGQNAGAAFWEAQMLSHSDGRWLARRTLDPTARHCKECPGYEQREWVPVDQVVPVGTACSCRGFCRCICTYKLAALSDRLPV